MSSRLFQGIIHQMKQAVDRAIGIIDENSIMIACSDLGRIGEAHELQTIPYGSTEVFVRGQNTYRILGNGQSVEYILFVEGNVVQAE